MNQRIALALIASLGVICAPAFAQEAFPSRLITLVVPFPPGSTSDLIPRMLAPLIGQSMGVPVAVNQWLYKDLAYSPEKDLAPITNAASTPNLLACR